MMKTLIINGSPRTNGDTASLINVIKENIDGEYRIIDSHRCSISPCLDCRFCWKNNGCAINDEMQEIYDYVLIDFNQQNDYSKLKDALSVGRLALKPPVYT